MRYAGIYVQTQAFQQGYLFILSINHAKEGILTYVPQHYPTIDEYCVHFHISQTPQNKVEVRTFRVCGSRFKLRYVNVKVDPKK